MLRNFLLNNRRNRVKKKTQVAKINRKISRRKINNILWVRNLVPREGEQVKVSALVRIAQGGLEQGCLDRKRGLPRRGSAKHWDTRLQRLVSISALPLTSSGTVFCGLICAPQADVIKS